MAQDTDIFQIFRHFMDDPQHGFAGSAALAVAVSGGPDSMALCHMMAEWAAGLDNSPIIHALHVDHGLRAESAEEAAQVADSLGSIDGVQAHILTWEHDGVDTKLQEEARNARYDLMAAHCAAHGIAHLFLAHHQNDQAETVLFRLAKGSGLDGLCGMQNMHEITPSLIAVRPLLEISKDELISFCNDRGVSYLKDPSNSNDAFARVRLRQSYDVLAEEGLTPSRLSKTAKRMLRAKKALDVVADEIYNKALLLKNTKQIVLKLNVLQKSPDEIVLRCILKAMDHLGDADEYGPRMEKVEALVEDLICADAFQKRTLGGVIFERRDEDGQLHLMKEQAHKSQRKT